MSEATKPAPSARPATRGDDRRAATITSGWDAWTTAMANDPSTRARAARTAPARSAPPAMSCSIRWARTSLSVSERSSWPAETSSSPSSTWFSMIPLWMRASRPVQSVWGWALRSVGPPWVAQRVCPIPVEARGAPPTAPTSAASLPARRRTHTRSPSTRATPDESYPRYSRRLSPSRRKGRAAALPVTPTMPHMAGRLGRRRGFRAQRAPDGLAQHVARRLRLVLGDRLHHHPDHGLGPAGPDEHPPALAQVGLHGLDGRREIARAVHPPPGDGD